MPSFLHWIENWESIVLVALFLNYVSGKVHFLNYLHVFICKAWHFVLSLNSRKDTIKIVAKYKNEGNRADCASNLTTFFYKQGFDSSGKA